MKPSPSRMKYAAKFRESNKLIRQFLRQQPSTGYVDVFDKMMGKNKEPLPQIFQSDSLHLNEEGYKIWQKAIKPALIPNQ